MNLKRKKTEIISNVILIVAIAVVVSVSFFPTKIVPIYGGKRISAIYNGDRSKPCVSLMFNVYENTDTVNSILDVLSEYGAKATFFVGGCWADDNAKTLNRIVNEGHEIGNHGYFHKDHAVLNYENNKREISLSEKITEALCGVKPTLFAPPSGSFSENTLEAAYDLGYSVVMWTKDTIDWRDDDTEKIFKRATENVSGGDLVLMHPKSQTLKVLPDVLGCYALLGLRAVTVSENIS